MEADVGDVGSQMKLSVTQRAEASLRGFPGRGATRVKTQRSRSNTSEWLQAGPVVPHRDFSHSLRGRSSVDMEVALLGEVVRGCPKSFLWASLANRDSVGTRGGELPAGQGPGCR